MYTIHKRQLPPQEQNPWERPELRFTLAAHDTARLFRLLQQTGHPLQQQTTAPGGAPQPEVVPQTTHGPGACTRGEDSPGAGPDLTARAASRSVSRYAR